MIKKDFKNIYKILYSKINLKSVSEMSWVFAGQILSVGLGFIILKLLSKMGTYEFGIYSLVITIIAFFGLIFYGPLQQGFLRFYYNYAEKKQTKIFVKLIYKILFVSAIILLTFSIIVFIISRLTNWKDYSFLFLISGTFVITFKLNEFFNSILNLIRKRKENTFFQAIEKIITIGFFYLLLFENGLEVLNVLIILVCISLVFFTLKLFFFNKFLPGTDEFNDPIKKIQSDIRTNLFTYIFPFLIWGIAAWLQLNGEKWIIANYLTTSDVGIYGMMMALVNALVVIPNNIVSEFGTPIIFQQFSDLTNKEKLETGKIYIYINMFLVFLFSLFATLITFIWGKELIIIISNKNYAVYSNLLPILCLGTGLFLTGQAQVTLGLALNKPKKYLFPKISIGLISIVLNILLINIYGLNGIAYTLLTIGIFYVFYIAIVNKKIMSNYNLQGPLNK